MKAVLLALLQIAQVTPNPTDVELHAAYCVGRLRAISEIPETAPTPEGNAIIRRSNADLADDRLRLSVYLMPKMAYLDASAISAAMNLGESDQRKYMDLAKACTPAANATALGECLNNAGAQKLIECRELKFLPF